VCLGTPPAEVCRQPGVSEATFYVWKKKCAHPGVSERRKPRSLEDKNARLKSRQGFRVWRWKVTAG